jgi:hypothetical protein
MAGPVRRAESVLSRETELALSKFRRFRRHLLKCPRMSEFPVPSDDAMKAAWLFLEHAGHRLKPAAVVRSADGGVTICFTNHGHYADIEFCNDGEVLGVTSNGPGNADVFDVTPSPSGEDYAIARITGSLRSSESPVLRPA